MPDAIPSTPVHAAPHRRRLAWAGFWLGFGLAMFFDGIILHQILQWHHLLSGVAPGDTLDGLRFQVLADGLFHLVTYGLTLAGLWLLWSGRRGLGVAGTDRRLIALGLVGFGVWHIVDAVLSHWLLGLHRIRMDTDTPLVWDLLWVVPFGLGAVLLGLWLLRGAPTAPGGGARRSVPVLLVLLVAITGPLSAMPPPDGAGDRALVVFMPGMAFGDIVAAAEAAGGRPVWSDGSGGLWLIALEHGARPAALYRHGALLVSNGPVAVGCLSWSRL